MHLIRNVQLSGINSPRIEDCVEKIVPYLEKTFPDDFDRLTKPKVQALVSKAVEKGTQYGFTQVGHFTAWASLLLNFGEDLDDKPENAWMVGILVNPVLAPDAKINLIIERMANSTST